MTPADAKHYLRLAIAHIEYQTSKIDGLETQLICSHQYVNAAHQKLYLKDGKKAVRATEQLAAGGRRNLTSDEWEEAVLKEANEKNERERLISEYKEWLEKEKAEQKVEDDKRMKEWTAYKDEYLKNNPRRKRCDRNKPTILKRPDTPEQFWSIRPKRAWVAERVEDLVDSEEDEDGDHSDLWQVVVTR